MEAEEAKLKTFQKRKLFKENDISQINNLIANDIGTTANVLLLKNNNIYVANVGDSLSVIYKKNTAIRLNKEHKTTNEKEFNRIKKSEGN